MSATKWHRKHEEIIMRDSMGKVKDRRVEKRDKEVPAFAIGKKDCPVCGLPMALSVGQIAKTHGGKCRKLYRHRKLIAIKQAK